MTKPISAVNNASALAASCRQGDTRALARLISLLESSDTSESNAAGDAVVHFDYPRHVIGISGPPGAGKSTLVAYLAELSRKNTPSKVAILAIDPSSPFTGGALLGDRIRMAGLRNDPNVFIRSMGSRGASGGISAAASGALRALGAAGFDTVFLETVGAGQAETEIANLAHTVCVVQVPGLGDEVQLMKMGILEAADVFAVNKSDKPESADLKARLEAALAEHPDSACRVLKQLGRTFAASFTGQPWMPPVVLLSALRQENGAELLAALEAHRQWLDQPLLSEALRRQRAAREIISRCETLVRQRAALKLEAGMLDDLTDALLAGNTSLHAAGTELLKRLL